MLYRQVYIIIIFLVGLGVWYWAIYDVEKIMQLNGVLLIGLPVSLLLTGLLIIVIYVLLVINEVGARKILTRKQQRQKLFLELYGFNPCFISRESYRKEVLLKLVIIAQQASVALKEVTTFKGKNYLGEEFKTLEEILDQMDDAFRECEKLLFGKALTLTNCEKKQQKIYQYEEAVSKYLLHIDLLESYDTEFAKTIPHWSELMNFVKEHNHARHSANMSKQYSFIPQLT